MIILPASHVLAANITLSWTPPSSNADGSALSDMSGYTIYYGTQSGNYTHSIDAGNVTSYSMDSLVPGFVYYFAVTAYDIYGNESTYSREVSMYVTNNDISAPVISGVYASDIKSTSAAINWTTDEAADTQVEYGATLSFGYITSADASLVTNHRQIISVAPSKQYYYRVLSRDASGNLSVSEPYTFKSAEPADLTPPDIYNIQVTNITSTSATVSWMTNEAATSQIEYGFNTSYGSKTAHDTTLVTVHSVNITGLLSYATYNFRVISLDAGYNEALSGNGYFTTSNMAPAITYFSGTPGTAYTYDVITFTASASDQDGYIVRHEWDFNGDGNYDSDTGSVPNAYYRYQSTGNFNARLRVTDNSGASTVSGAETILIESPVSQPTLTVYLTADPSSGSAPLSTVFYASISDPNVRIISYEWDLDGNGLYEAKTTTSPISNTFSNPGTYIVKVRATDSYGATSTGEATVVVYSTAKPRKGGSRHR
ncbi:MAG: fibronectin type III domain-containing protein [Nitrospirae bacterium]|nr:fibronectin type III domain-containing protein [Nitrospirota bacterium]